MSHASATPPMRRMGWMMVGVAVLLMVISGFDKFALFFGAIIAAGGVLMLLVSAPWRSSASPSRGSGGRIGGDNHSSVDDDWVHRSSSNSLGSSSRSHVHANAASDTTSRGSDSFDNSSSSSSDSSSSSSSSDSGSSSSSD